MIQSFADKHTETLFDGGPCHRQWRVFEKAAAEGARAFHERRDPVWTGR